MEARTGGDFLGRGERERALKSGRKFYGCANKINMTVTVLETMTLAPLDAERQSWNVSATGVKCRFLSFSRNPVSVALDHLRVNKPT